VENQLYLEYEELWQRVLELIEESGEVSDAALSMWFADIRIIDVADDKVTFALPSEFKAQTVEKRYHEIIKRFISYIMDTECDIEIICDNSDYVPPVLEGQGFIVSPLDLANKNLAKKKAEAIARGEIDPADEAYKSSDGEGVEKLTYNDDYTFDNFVVGISNNFAYAYAQTIAEDPAGRYNPFFIYGPSGVGKTHLLYAITNLAMTLHPDKKITFVKGEEFTNQLVESISHKTTAKFREKYRGTDILLIDDVHFIAGRESTQEEFFHTFNSLFEGKKQIIVSSDRPPKEMHTLESRIRSRFESGLLADIQSPDFDIRSAIIKRKSLAAGMPLTSDVADFLATKVTSNIRQIEGVITKLSARYLLTGYAPTVESIRSMIPEFLEDDDPPAVVAGRILTAAANHFSVDEADVIGTKRDKNVRLARNAAIFIIRKSTDMSFPEIGKMFSRSHPTIYSSFITAESAEETDHDFATSIREIMRDARV